MCFICFYFFPSSSLSASFKWILDWRIYLKVTLDNVHFFSGWKIWVLNRVCLSQMLMYFEEQGCHTSRRLKGNVLTLKRLKLRYVDKKFCSSCRWCILLHFSSILWSYNLVHARVLCIYLWMELNMTHLQLPKKKMLVWRYVGNRT